jgi:hypothetical protein
MRTGWPDPAEAEAARMAVGVWDEDRQAGIRRRRRAWLLGVRG